MYDAYRSWKSQNSWLCNKHQLLRYFFNQSIYKWEKYHFKHIIIIMVCFRFSSRQLGHSRTSIAPTPSSFLILWLVMFSIWETCLLLPILFSDRRTFSFHSQHLFLTNNTTAELNNNIIFYLPFESCIFL